MSKTLKLTDEEQMALRDSLNANLEETYQRIEEIENGNDWDAKIQLVRGYISLYKKAFGVRQCRRDFGDVDL